jgi:hypothetical protein
MIITSQQSSSQVRVAPIGICRAVSPTYSRIRVRQGAVKESDTKRVEIVNQLRLSAEKLMAIDKRLEEAEKASERLGRKDWKSLFYGIVLGLIVNDVISPEVAQHLFMGVVHIIAHLLGFGISAEPRILAKKS